MVTDWNSREDLIHCLVASCYIPCFTGCTRLSDETYQCRDAVFSADLSTFLEGFDVVVARSNNGVDIANICENLVIVSNDRLWSLMEMGAKDCRNTKKLVRFIDEVISHDRV